MMKVVLGILVMHGYPILFFVKHEFKRLFHVIHHLKVSVTREELEFLTDIRDFTTPFSLTLIHKSSE